MQSWNAHPIPSKNYHKHFLYVHISLYTYVLVQCLYCTYIICHAQLQVQGYPTKFKGLQASCNRAAAIDASLIPTASEAVSSFHAMGGRLQLFSKFGDDPLDGHTFCSRTEKRLSYLGFHHFSPYSIKYRTVIAHNLRKQLSSSLILQTNQLQIIFRSTDIIPAYL